MASSTLIGRVTLEMAASIVRLQQDLAQARSSIDRAVTNMQRSINRLQNSFAALGVGLAFGGIARDILRTNREMESLRARLISVTGSADGARRAFSFIQKFAIETPFEIKDLTTAFITLQNFGLKPTAEVMNALTNQAAKSGASAENLQGIALALGQAWGKAKLQGQEILQLINQGVPIYQLLAEVTGKNSQELFKMAEQGALTRDVIDGVIKKMGELASGSNANAMNTLNGQISNLADSWHTFEDALLQDKSEGALKTIVSGMSETFKLVTHAIDDSAESQIAHLQDVIDFQDQFRSFLGMAPISHAGDIAQKQALKKAQDDLNATTLTAKENEKAFNAEAAKSEAIRLKAESILSGLNDEFKKSTLSHHDYIVQSLEEQKITGKLATEILHVTDAIDQQKEAEKASVEIKKQSEKVTSDQQKAEDDLAKSIDADMRAIQDRNMQLSMSEHDYLLASISAKNYGDTITKAMVHDIENNKAWEKKHELQNAEISTLDDLMNQYNQLTLSARQYFELQQVKKGIKGPELEPIMQQFDAVKQIEQTKKQTDDAKKSLDDYIKSIDATSASFNNLSSVASAVFDASLGGINTMVGAFDTMSKSIDENSKRLIENAKQQKTAVSENKTSELIKLKQEEADLIEKNNIAALSGVRQLAGATASMFKENSQARKTFHALEVGLGAIELAMEIKGLAAKAADAVLTQGKGDPYSAFFRMAAMTAIVGGIVAAAGGAFKGASGGGSAPTLASGMGTTLGDSTKTSDSVNKTLDLLKSIHAEEYAELRGINRGVHDLAGAITGTVTKLFQGGGLQNINVPGLGQKYQPNAIVSVMDAANTYFTIGLHAIAKNIPVIGGIINKIDQFLFGGKIKKEITGQGIQTGAASIADILAGGQVGGSQFTNIKTTKTGGIFGKTKTSFDTILSPLDTGITESLSKIFNSAAMTMIDLADSLGTGISDRVRNYVIEPLMIELQGLNGEEAAKKLNGVISATLDRMATTVFSDIIGQYQQLGEGLLETAVRIVSEVAIVRDALAQSGLSLASNAIAISDAMVQAAGGLQEFQSGFEKFFDKFFTEGEKQNRLQTRLTSALADYNLILPGTREGYRQLVDGLDMSNARYAQQYALLIGLSDSADKYYSTIEAQTKAATEKAIQLAQEEKAAKTQIASAERREMVSARRAIQKVEADAFKAQQEAYAALVTDVDTLHDSLLKSGDATKILANQMRAVQINQKDFMKGGVFNAGGFNSALAVERAKAELKIANDASMRALEIQNAAGLIHYRQNDAVIDPIKQGIIQAINEASGSIGTFVVRDSVAGVARAMAESQARSRFESRAPGLASVFGAQGDLNRFAKPQTIDNQLFIGKTAIEYARSVHRLGLEFATGRISAEQFTGAMGWLKKNLGDLKDYATTLERISATRMQLSFAVGMKGLESIQFYFERLNELTGKLNEAAAQASEPISKTAEAIGRLNSVSSAFGESARAVIRGFQGAGKSGEMFLSGQSLTGSETNKALLIAQAAAIASQAMTTADAAAIAEQIATKSAFVGVAASGIRDAALLLDGIQRFDPGSFENAFMRINNALATGALNEQQYSVLFNSALDSFQGMDEQLQKYNDEVARTADAFQQLRDAAKSLADQLLIDSGVSTLSGAQTLDEAQRQYRETLQKATQGDVEAAGNLQNITRTMLDIAKANSSSEVDYARTFGRTIGDIRQLETMPTPMAQPFIPNAPVGANDPVIAELKALREELAQLRGEQKIGNAQIAANTGNTVKRLDEFNAVGMPTVALV